MANIIIAGDACVVTSARTLEDIKLLEKYRPKALALYEEDEDGAKVEVFRVASTKGDGSINRYGVSFSGVTHDEAKKATVTLSFPANVTDAKEYVVEAIGPAVNMLNKVEQQFEAALAEVEAEKQAVRNSITVV